MNTLHARHAVHMLLSRLIASLSTGSIGCVSVGALFFSFKFVQGRRPSHDHQTNSLIRLLSTAVVVLQHQSYAN